MCRLINEHDKTIPMRLKVILIDETHYFREDFAEKGGKIFAAYLYDENCVTYLCSQQKAYFLRFLYYNSTKGPEDDRENEKFRDELDEAFVGEEGLYFDARSIDDRPENTKMLIRVREVEDDEEYEREFEDAYEYLRGNWIFTTPEGE